MGMETRACSSILGSCVTLYHRIIRDGLCFLRALEFSSDLHRERTCFPRFVRSRRRVLFSVSFIFPVVRVSDESGRVEQQHPSVSSEGGSFDFFGVVVVCI